MCIGVFSFLDYLPYTRLLSFILREFIQCMRWLLRDPCFLIVRKYFPNLQWIDILMGADNLSPHYSEANLCESRELFEIIKAVWCFTPGGFTDVVAGPDNSLVQLEKLKIRRYSIPDK